MKLGYESSKFQCKLIDEAPGWDEFFKSLRLFMESNNFPREQIDTIVHTLNGFYYFHPKTELRKDS